MVFHHQLHPEQFGLPAGGAQCRDHRVPPRRAIAFGPSRKGPQEACPQLFRDVHPGYGPQQFLLTLRVIGHSEVVHEGDVDDLQFVVIRRLAQLGKMFRSRRADVFVLQLDGLQTEILGAQAEPVHQGQLAGVNFLCIRL